MCKRGKKKVLKLANVGIVLAIFLLLSGLVLVFGPSKKTSDIGDALSLALTEELSEDLNASDAIAAAVASGVGEGISEGVSDAVSEAIAGVSDTGETVLEYFTE